MKLVVGTCSQHLIDQYKTVVFESFSNVVLPAGVLVVPAVVQMLKSAAYVPVINVKYGCSCSFRLCFRDFEASSNS